MNLRAPAAATVLLLTLSGCGVSGPAGDTSTGSGEPEAGPADLRGPGAPGASGRIAAVSGRTAQVQSDASGQVAVTWTGRTEISQEVDAARTDVAVGDCVMVVADEADDADEADVVAADTVRITEPEDGSCGTRRREGGGPGEGPTAPPEGDLVTGAPGERPEGMPGGTAGQVVAVTDDGFTVEAMRPTDDGSTPDSTQVEVTVSSATTYTTTADATAAAVEVGRCLTAVGDADDTGAVTATRIDLTDPVGGACDTGFAVRVDGVPS
jgi:Domain of unknown function (DUF5666)